MTMAEFDTWIEQHYGELLAVAKTLVRPQDAEDVVQNAVASMYTSPLLDLSVRLHVNEDERRAGLRSVWAWARGVVRGMASHSRRSGTNRVPGLLRGEESTRDAKDTKVEERSKMKRLPKDKDAERFANKYYLKRLEQDREIFDMDGHGREKKDKSFEVRL